MGKHCASPLFCIVLILVMCAPSYSYANDEQFGYPVSSHSVLTPFSMVSTYGPGHRGVSFSVAQGEGVHAIADGRIIFVGRVAGTLFVSIQHGKDYVSSYSALATEKVSLGDQVRKGDVVGTARGQTPSGEKNAVFVSLRFRGTYVDPMKYISGEAIPLSIFLVPAQKPGDSVLKKLSDIEKGVLTPFVDAGGAVIDGGVAIMTGTGEVIVATFEDGLSVLADMGDEFVQAYREASVALDEMKKLAGEVAVNAARGADDLVHQGLDAMKTLESELVEKMNRVFVLGAQMMDAYRTLFSRALSTGIKTAWWFTERVVAMNILPHKLARDLVYGLHDHALSFVHTTFKILDQYFDVDWEMLLREMTMPATCLVNACTMPVVLACDPGSSFTPRNSGYVGSGNSVMFVPGINTHGSSHVLTDDDGMGSDVGQSVNFPWKTLGYERSDVTYYSYESSGEYETEDTHQDVYMSAANMDTQIRVWKREHEGEKLDVIAHSLGGAVATLWLSEFYDPNDKGYPELGSIILYAPPITGTSLASAGGFIDSSDDGIALHGDVDRLETEFNSNLIPPSGSESWLQVGEGENLAEVVSASLAVKKLNVYVLRSSSDVVVSAASPSIDGVEEILIDTDGVNPLNSFSAHGSITTNSSMTAVSQYILEGSKPPCVSAVNALGTLVKAPIVHAAEMTIGRVARDGLGAVGYEQISDFINTVST